MTSNSGCATWSAARGTATAEARRRTLSRHGPSTSIEQVIDMNDSIVTLDHARKPDAATRRALLICGLWMRAGFVGASATAAGVIQLFEGDWSMLTALST